jgi:hypothetical protein
MTASMISMGYHLAVVLHLIGALCLVRWTATGHRWWLMTALAGGTASLWTLDAAATVHPLTPLLAWAVARSPESRRRLFVGAAAWWACAVPYYIAFLTFLADSTGYAADAIVPSSWTDRILRLADLFAYNFQPWVWAFARPQWYAPVHPHSSWFDGLLLAVVGAAVAAVAFVRLRRGDQALVSQPRAGWPARAWLVAVFIAFTALANATFMAVHLAEFHYRTQLLSRVWASLALAAAVTIALDRGRVARFVAVGVGMAFIVLGILGGRERQAYFSDYWQRHQRELASIADIVRRLPLDATLVLRRAAESRFAATEAPYLARAWTTLLSADPTLECRTFLASADRGTHCSPEPDALVCRGDVSPRCGIDAERGMRVPYDRLVVMTYDPVQPGFGVDATLPATFTPRGAAGATSADRYAPERLFIERPASWLARSLLR